MDERRRAKRLRNLSGKFLTRAKTFHQVLMEDFRFMEAARTQSGEYEGATLSTDDLKLPENLKELAVINPHGLVNLASYTHKPVAEVDKNQRIVIQDVRARRFMTRMSKYPPVDIWAHWLLNANTFQTIMIVVIVLNSIVLMVDEELPDYVEHRNYRFALDILDFLFLMIFVAEIILKWLDNFSAFWMEWWNIFDFLITTLSVIGVCLEYFVEEGTTRIDFGALFQVIEYVRVLRIFRTMNVVTRWKRIKIIWDAVMSTFRSLIFIFILMLLFFYIFAIVGIQLFDRFTHSHRTDLDYHRAFEDLPRAMITLFQLFTLDHWYKLLQSLIRAMGPAWPLTYCLLWILLGSFIFKNFFAGVMVNNFQNIRRELTQDATDLAANAKRAVELNVFGLDEDEDDSKKKNPKDDLVDFEDNVFNDLEIVKALKSGMSPTLWPRDTLFQYYVLLETIANNLDEREQLLKLLNEALLRNYDV